MKLTMLGTGNALVTKCYNTCFVIQDEGKYFLCDGGGGSLVLAQLEKTGIDWKSIKHIFITHKHIDHLMGIVWMVRMICQNMSQNNYDGEAFIYGHEEVIRILDEMAHTLLSKKMSSLIGDRLHLVIVEDGEEREIIGHSVSFFDIQSTKAKQFGFSMKLNDKDLLTCCGDEPYNECERRYAENAKWLLLEAFCLHGQADIFKPYEKHHSTVMDACKLAEGLKVKNVLLYHTEDKNIVNRKNLYTEEGEKYFSGNIFVPYDLETIEL